MGGSWKHKSAQNCVAGLPLRRGAQSYRTGESRWCHGEGGRVCSRGVEAEAGGGARSVAGSRGILLAAAPAWCQLPRA